MGSKSFKKMDESTTGGDQVSEQRNELVVSRNNLDQDGIIELEAEEVSDPELVWTNVGLSDYDFIGSAIKESRHFRETIMKAYGVTEDDMLDPKDFKESIKEANKKLKIFPRPGFTWEEVEQLQQSYNETEEEE